MPLDPKTRLSSVKVVDGSFRGFDRVLRGTELIMSAAGGALVVLMMLAITIDVIGRHYFNTALTGTYETVQGFFMVGAVWLCLPAVQRAGGNVRVGIVMDRLSPRNQYWVSLAPTTAVAFTLAKLAWTALERGIDRWGDTQYNTLIPLPTGLSWLMMGLGLMVTVLQLVVDVLRPVLGTGESELSPARKDGMNP